jgi:anti-sigma factor (TIGR02949 family)
VDDASCREVLRDLERYVDGECSDQFQAAIARHLADCPPCLSRSDFERALRALVARYCREPAPPWLLNDVLQLLR